MRIPYVPNPPPTQTEEESAIVTRIAARRAPASAPIPRPRTAAQPACGRRMERLPGRGAHADAAGRTSARAGHLPRRRVQFGVVRMGPPRAAGGCRGPRAGGAGGREEGRLGGRERGDRAEAGKEGLGGKEWAVLKYADEMTRLVRVGDATFEELRRFCDEREVVEVTATVAAYNCVSRFLVALDVGERNGTGPDNVKH